MDTEINTKQLHGDFLKVNLQSDTLSTEEQLELQSFLRNDDSMLRFSQEKYCREFLVPSNRELIKYMQYFPENIAIIGLGGIGSWVSFFISRIKQVKNIFLIDPDVVEISNISRTPFSVLDVGSAKVDVSSKLISDNSPEKKVFTILDYFGDASLNVMKNVLVSENLRTTGITIVDCRDDSFQDYQRTREKLNNVARIQWIRTAYDGQFITMDFNPENTNALGVGGYETQPSQVIPSSLAGLMAVEMIMKYATINTNPVLKNLMKYPITFDVTLLLEYIFIGQKILQKEDKRPEIKKLFETDTAMKCSEYDAMLKMTQYGFV